MTRTGMDDWIAALYAQPDLLRMGHQQRAEDLNLGLGWIYYGLARIVRPARVVVVGSWRGYTPLVFGRALQDNVETGEVIFIDPSLVDDFWADPARVRAHFAGLGVHNVRHVRMTTAQFRESGGVATLDPVGLVLIDGYHTAEQARIDFETFEPLLAPEAIVLLHDSVAVGESRRYGPGREYVRDVVRYVDELRARADLQVFDLPFGAGLTLVRKTAHAG